MKLLLALLLTSFAASATVVDGKIVYKLNDELVSRDVTLEVPARGQGEVVLSGDKFEWRTKNFWNKTVLGQTTFVAVFKADHAQHKATVVLKGTYLKGNNRIIYYGDVYKAKGHVKVDKDLQGLTHSGGFMFNYER